MIPVKGERGSRVAVSLAAAIVLFMALSSRLESTDSESKSGLDWGEVLEKPVEWLREGRYDKALSASEKAVRRVVEDLGPGERARKELSRALLLQSVAEAGLGRGAAASWHYQVAVEIGPELAALGADQLGPGFHLIDPETDALESQRPQVEDFPDDAITAPRPLTQAKPKFPRGARYARVTGRSVVQVIIDRHGRPHHPRIVESLGVPSLDFVALEAMRSWRFEPARLYGEPVAVYYNLSVNWKLVKSLRKLREAQERDQP